MLHLAGTWGLFIENVFARRPIVTLFISLVISPGAMIVIARVLENRRLPLLFNAKAFLPGDIFLGLALFFSCRLVPTLPETGWWQSDWWIISVTTAMFVFTLAMMFIIDGPHYSWQARLSPTKLWHDLVCYGFWGTALVAIIPPILLAAPDHPDKNWIHGCISGYLLTVIVDIVSPPRREILHTGWDLGYWR